MDKKFFLDALLFAPFFYAGVRIADNWLKEEVKDADLRKWYFKILTNRYTKHLLIFILSFIAGIWIMFII